MLSSINPVAESILPEKDQIKRQLSALGYNKGDTVFLRAFLPSNHPEKNNDKGRKDSFDNLTELISTVTKWQQQGLGIYIVVNGGGHTDKEVTECRAIFYEHDNLDKEIQITLWKSLNLPTPTFQIDTGGKSIHSYWVFTERIEPDSWRVLQTDLLDYADADRSLKNPSRVMRLAGCLHASGRQSEIISESGKTYSFSELRSAIPKKEPIAKPAPLPSLLDDVPLYQCLSKDDRSLIDGGQAQPGRNTIGAKLARNLIGTSSRLAHLGNRYSGQPRDLFDDYCSRCSPPLDTKEADSIWRSAEKDNPTATLSDDALENCIKSWQRKQQIEKTPEPHNGVFTPAFGKSTTNPLISTVQALIDKDLPKYELEALLPEVAEQTGRATNDIRRIYHALSKEHQNAEERQEACKQIPQLLEAQQLRIDPFSIFWGDGGKFAQALQDVATSMPTSVENLITTLIPAIGSRMGTSARIVVSPASNYTQPAIFWSCIVAPTGRLKTPAQEVIISPLMQLEAEQYQWAEAIKEEYETDLKNYKKSPDSEPPIKPPPRKRFMVGGATAETRIKIHADNPKGLLNYRDEWSSFINGRNKYRNGKGDDLELDLSEFNGAGIFKDTASENLFLERSAISRTGNTQPETLQKFLAQQDFEDYTGEFARWLFCLVPGDIAYIDLFKSQDNTGSLLQAMLKNLYLLVDALPKKDYFLTDDSKRIFQAYHRRLTDAEIEENHPGLRATYPKLKSYLARLALWLHIVNAALAGHEPESMISGSTMQIAATLTSFYLAQAQILYKGSNHKITGNLLKIKEFIEKRNGVTAREIRCGVFSLRQTPTSEVLKSCMCLKEQGLVSFDGKKFYFSAKNIITLAESLATQAVEGDDLGSSKIITSENFQVKSLIQRGVEGDDQRSSLDHHFIISPEKNQTFESDDLLMIFDHQKDHHPQMQSEQELENLVDDRVMISDHHPQHQSEQGLQDSISGIDDQFSKMDKKEILDCNNSNTPLLKPVQEGDRTLVTVEGKLGKSTADILVVRRLKRYIEILANYVFADGSSESHQLHPTDLQEAVAIAKLEIQRWESIQPSNNPPVSYRVRQLGDEDFVWIENCQLLEIPKPPISNWYVFEAPIGERLRVCGADDFIAE